MPSADEALIDALAALERSSDLAGAVRRLGADRPSPQALQTIAVSLYRRELPAVAFVIVRQLIEAGFENWLLSALEAHLAITLEQWAAAAAGIARLDRALADSGAAERDAVRAFLDPFLPRAVVAVFHRGETAKLRAYRRLWRLVDPQSMHRFAAPPPHGQRGTPRFLEVGDERRLLQFMGPPEGAQRAPRRVVLAARRYWIIDDPRSREHDIPARIAAAILAYGWQATRTDLRSFIEQRTVTEDYGTIAAQCRALDADLLIIDEFQPQRGGNGAPAEIMGALKRDLPRLRVIGLYLDPWVPEQWNDIEAGAPLLDAAWSPVVTPLWQRAAFRGKSLFAPLPHAGVYRPTVRRAPGLTFHGGVQSSNWDRAFWLDAIATAGLELRTNVSTHAQDHQDAVQSYRGYMQDLSARGAVVNFARRGNGVHTLTARTFEVLAAGSLLVQEAAPDLDLFLVAGRHYLRFETLADLAAIDRFIRNEPERAAAIARDGAAFFLERYADERIMGYLDGFLFHPHHARDAA